MGKPAHGRRSPLGDVRGDLAVRLRKFARVRVVDGRRYRHPAYAWIAALERGDAIELPALYVRGIVSVPADCRVRVERDGTVTVLRR